MLVDRPIVPGDRQMHLETIVRTHIGKPATELFDADRRSQIRNDFPGLGIQGRGDAVLGVLATRPLGMRLRLASFMIARRKDRLTVEGQFIRVQQTLRIRMLLHLLISRRDGLDFLGVLRIRACDVEAPLFQSDLPFL